MENERGIYVGGRWLASTSEATVEVVDSHTEEVFGSVPAGSADDVEKAVAAARAAFEPWSLVPPAERAEHVLRMAEHLASRSDELARTITREVGMPLKLSQRVQVGLPIGTLKEAPHLAKALEHSEVVGNSTLVREPVGVVACITPWNYPLHQAAAKVAPALVAGCTVVLKPSEVAPFSAFALADAAEAAGLPDGVFNLVSGTGPVVGEALARHPEVDMVSFTGSTRAGRRVAELGAASVKRIALELGGKSPSVILEDADLEAAVKATVSDCYLNSGQTCSAFTRMLVPRSRMDEAAGLAKAFAEAMVVGDPFDAKTRLGPLSSAVQRERVRGYIEDGIREGARLVTGGIEPPEGLPRGFYVRPTVFADVTPSMRIAQEEIFGPVLSILGYDDEEDAIRIANGTIYGLAAGVWSADEARALRVARRLRAGQVDVNGAAFNPRAPFGGFKQSGRGREYGVHGLLEFTELKSIQR
ncbi:MAG: aldehyde dehydrogenase family protein [Polyangiales bacterium]